MMANYIRELWNGLPIMAFSPVLWDSPNRETVSKVRYMADGRGVIAIHSQRYTFTISWVVCLFATLYRKKRCVASDGLIATGYHNV